MDSAGGLREGGPRARGLDSGANAGMSAAECGTMPV